MEHSEQENIELRGTVTTLQEKLESLTTLVDSLMAAQNQQPPPNSQATVTSEVTTPVSTLHSTFHLSPCQKVGARLSALVPVSAIISLGFKQPQLKRLLHKVRCLFHIQG